MPHEALLTTVPVQQRQSVPTVLDMLRFRVGVRKGAVPGCQGPHQSPKAQASEPPAKMPGAAPERVSPYRQKRTAGAV